MLAAYLPNRTGTFRCIRLSRSLFQTSCIPSPCLKHCPERLSTMDAPSPCIRRCLGDPLVTLLLWSKRRCLVRRTPLQTKGCLQEKRLSTLQISIDNPGNRRLRFRQFSFHHIWPSCPVTKCRTFRPCYCPLHLFRILGKVVLYPLPLQ